MLKQQRNGRIYAPHTLGLRDTAGLRVPGTCSKRGGRDLCEARLAAVIDDHVAIRDLLGCLPRTLGTGRLWGWRSGPLVRALRRHGVSMVVIGGVAAYYYDRRRMVPADLDVVVGTSAANAVRTVEALLAIVRRFPPRTAIDELSAVAVQRGVDVTLDSDQGVLHIVGSPSGRDRDDLVRNRRWVVIDRTLTPICRLDDLIALKESERRPKDIADLDLLGTAIGESSR